MTIAEMGPEPAIKTRRARMETDILSSSVTDPTPTEAAAAFSFKTTSFNPAAPRAEETEKVMLSIVVPVYNETEVLAEFHARLTQVLDKLAFISEIAYVNDGSTDSSLKLLRRFRSFDDRVAIINLSRNFGKEIATTAGLDHARGEATVVIDADLQDPPELISALVDKWREGFDVVYATRRERQGESWLKRTTASLFYRVMHSIGEVPIPEDTGDFRLLNRRCLNALGTCRERRRFMKGLFAWVGFNQTSISYDRAPRHAGTTKWNYWRLWNFAIEGITSFTIAPLKAATYLGLLTALSAFAYGGIVIGRTLLLGRVVPGYASLMSVLLFSAGVQLIATGVIGEYIGRIFVEVKNRPLYLLEAYMPPRASEGALAAESSEEAPGRSLPWRK